MTDHKEIEIKNYIYIINFAIVAKRLFDICLYRKNCELNEKSVKLFSSFTLA